MPLVALALSALAAPADFRPLASVDGCQVYGGPTDADGVATLRAECHWPDASFDRLDAALAEVGAWEHVVRFIAEAERVDGSGDRSLVWQRHELAPLAPRESLLWIRATGDGDGRRYEWTAADVPYAFGADAVVAHRNDGWWELARAPDGGVDVVHQVTYDPGGSVPGWLVRWFQRHGALLVLADVHTLSRSG